MHAPPRRLVRTVSLAAVVAAVVAGAASVPTPPPARAAGADVVSTSPSTATPNIGDGATYAIRKVGSKVVVGGTFSTVTDRGGSSELDRSMLLAFDAATGKVDRDFAPTIQGRSVNALLPGPNDHTVYVSGVFTKVNGTTRNNMALLDTDTGELVSTFAPTFNGSVTTMRKGPGGRILAGGKFTKAGGGKERRGLASVSAETGKVDGYLDVALEGHHNYEGVPGQASELVGALAMDVSPDGEHLVVIGNFTSAGDEPRDQIVRIALGESSAAVDADWSTSRFEDTCNDSSFDSYVRGVDFSPDGSFLAVATTGGWGGTDTACDAAVRFDSGDTGDVEPTWVKPTGNDTLYSVAATDRVVYVGGHQRWLNNDNGRDRPGPGAVPRPGIGALDARNGMPLSWNPGRHPRGVGARVLYLVGSGLYVGSDTKYIGNRKYHRNKIAFFPVAGGKELPADATGSLPGKVVVAPGSEGEPVQRSFDGSEVGADEPLSGAGTWASVRGTFQVGDTLYYGYRDGTLRKRSFDGAEFGAVTTVDPYDDPAWSDVQTGSGQTYEGTPPGLYSKLSDVTGMAYRDGRLYYTTSGGATLYWRDFSPESGVVGAVAHEASTKSWWRDAGGMFFAGDDLYVASTANGNLYKVDWSDAVESGEPTKVSGPDVDGKDWKSRALFLAPA